MTRIAMYEGDCLEVLRGFRAGSVDLVMCSPPYEAARTYGVGFKLRGREWVKWAADRFMECLRVSRGLVVWVVEGQTRGYEWSATPMELAVEIKRRGAVLRKPPVFHRIGIPGSGGPDYFRNDYEFCIVATARKGKLPWSDNSACGHPPKFAPGGEPSYRLPNGRRCNLVHTKTMKDGRKKIQGYVVPKMANPGNVIRQQWTDEDFVVILAAYGQTEKTGPGEVLRQLRLAIESHEVPRWIMGVRARLHAETLLRSGVHGQGHEGAGRESLPAVREEVPSEQGGDKVLRDEVLRRCTGEATRDRASEGSGSSDCEDAQTAGSVRGVRKRRAASCSPSGREPLQQHGQESSGAVPVVPYQGPPETSCRMSHLWNDTSEAVQALRNSVRQALSAIQEAWRSTDGLLLPAIPKGREDSDVIRCLVGGGTMGDRLCHENEAPFPEALAERFIRSFCPPGGTALDCFGGSGTVGKVAAMHGRNAVLIDIRAGKGGLDTARRRIEAFNAASPDKAARITWPGRKATA